MKFGRTTVDHCEPSRAGLAPSTVEVVWTLPRQAWRSSSVGRNVVVPDHFRQHVEEKLARLERYDDKIHRADVELQHEKNPRQNGSCQHIEITCRTRGPVVRGRGLCRGLLQGPRHRLRAIERRFRQAADRRRDPSRAAHPAVARRGHRRPAGRRAGRAPRPTSSRDDGPGRIVREKEHTAEPMSVDQALLEMELVGHDFYLFQCADTGRASVVYRRHAYDYGLIRLGG